MSHSKLVVLSSSKPSKSTRTSGLETIKDERRDKKCILCNRWTVNEDTLGSLYVKDGVICHYYCLLFCCNIRQNGIHDTDGILGFLPQDIQKEVNRVTSTSLRNYNFYKCRFCKQPGATIGCFVKKCRMLYHFPCGLENGVRFRFTSTFDSYCKAHTGPEVFKPVILHDCPVCQESLQNQTNPIVLGRCCSLSNFHKECIQAYALRAGSHHLKCPICDDKDLFIRDVQFQGIFVPEKDADWETENDAFQELRQKYSHCDATECLCPSGRDRNDRYNGSIWHLLRCGSCAASAIHVHCAGSVNLVDKDFVLTKWWCLICREVDRRLQEKDNMPSATHFDARVDDNDKNNIGDAESILCSVSSVETLFTPIVVNRNLPEPEPIHRTGEGESDANLSVSFGGTLVAVVPKQPSDHNSQQKMHTSSPPSDIDKSTATAAIDTMQIQDIKIENEDAEGNRIPFCDNDVVDEDHLSTIVNNSNSKLEASSFSPILLIDQRPITVETIQDAGGIQNPDPVLSFPGSDADEDKYVTENDVVPVEPPFKRMKRVLDEATDLPAFNINETEQDGNDLKQVRCYCERYWDDETLVQCRRCTVYLHKNCLDGIDKIYLKTLQTRCCQECTDLLALKTLQEIPLCGKYVGKGCENTKSKTFYLTLVNKANELMVRRHDAVYISERGNRELESSRILRVERLWKNTRGTRYISGHFYYRPSETVNATTRKFYRNEIFRSSTPTETAIKVENVSGRCWILDPVTYCKGRPSAATLNDEKNVFICESWMDSQTTRISILRLAPSMHSICMKPNAFKEFVSEMKIKKDCRYEQRSSLDTSHSEQKSVAGADFDDYSVIDLDSD